jgi:hypothetical protein
MQCFDTWTMYGFRLGLRETTLKVIGCNTSKVPIQLMKTFISLRSIACFVAGGERGEAPGHEQRPLLGLGNKDARRPSSLCGAAAAVITCIPCTTATTNTHHFMPIFTNNGCGRSTIGNHRCFATLLNFLSDDRSGSAEFFSRNEVAC